MLAEVHGRLGDWANTGRLLDEASLIIKNTDERTHLSDLHRGRADLLIGTGDLIEGEQRYRPPRTAKARQRLLILG
jgi:hypothetical protein